MSKIKKISNYLGLKNKRQNIDNYLADIDKDLQNIFSSINTYLEINRIVIDQNTHFHIKLTGDTANASPSDGEIWFNGTNLKMRIGSSTYNIDMTAE